MYIFSILIMLSMQLCCLKSLLEKKMGETWNLNYASGVEWPVPSSSASHKHLKLEDTNYHNAILKKVDLLGDVLKQKVQVLQRNDGRKLDVVFLIDASSSVGPTNFNSELKFVKKLLADFTVSQFETRVAVISFSSQDKVVRHVDQISAPSEDHHKCNLFHRDLPAIRFSGGSTYTVGALLEAQAVLELSRKDTKRAVFLITDGFSNGGNPFPVAQSLKHNGTFIFTFGIRTGNTQELISMATSDEYSYLLDSFGQFEALARRALHQDLAVGSYQVLNNKSHCDMLCSRDEQQSFGCCDPMATCSCGTVSGHFSCLCPPGYYGSGLFGTCTLCPNGTYHDGSGPGDVIVCRNCPDPNHVTLGKATSMENCFCKRGFVSSGDKCEVTTCPILTAPTNGYFVNGLGKCPNILNAACGIRCKVGFTLFGSSIRLCQDDGSWSGEPPKCIVKMCPNPGVPENGQVTCSLDVPKVNDSFSFLYEERLSQERLTSLYAVDTECHFSCQEGYTLTGSRKRICLPLARWDGLRTSCKRITCPPLPKLSHGSVTPLMCIQPSRVSFGVECKIGCDPGYQLLGPMSRFCGGKGGQWSLKTNISRCIDVEPPCITCPQNTTVDTDQGEKYATIVLSQPVASDNSGKMPVIWTQPSSSSPIQLPLGTSIITFIAMDASRNQAFCNISVTVTDREPPLVESCISPQLVYLKERQGSSTVLRNEPVFHDNSKKPVTVTKSHSLGELPVGITSVIYTSTDEAGNNSSCIIEVIVEENHCHHATKQPYHGSVNCFWTDDKETLLCTLTCHKGYAFATNSSLQGGTFNTSGDDSFHYSCSIKETSANSIPLDISLLPKCSEVVLPNSIYQDGVLSLTGGPNLCKETTVMNMLFESLEVHLSRQLKQVCNFTTSILCDLGNITASCEEIFSAIEEESNIVHNQNNHVTSMYKTSDFLVNGGQRSKRETISAPTWTNVEIRFSITTELRRVLQKASNPGGQLLLSSGFGQLRESLHKTSLPLPPEVLARGLEWKGRRPKIRCNNGSIVHHIRDMCVRCPKGTFSVLSKCQPCPVGKYQELEGQMFCSPCPSGMGTKYENARSQQDCQPLCLPGTYGGLWTSEFPTQQGAVSPCTSCRAGWYQPSYGSTQCLKCPQDFPSSRVGAHTQEECIAEHVVLPVSGECHSELCCQKADGLITCNCPPNRYGSLCEAEMNDCHSSPCLHGGTCHNQDEKYYLCACTPGYTGKNCEMDIDECSLNPCQNNGHCEDLINGFHCECPDGYQGHQCEENIDDCFLSPCGSNGHCIDAVSNYTCKCVVGYSGHHCEKYLLYPCSKFEPCLNGATCINIKSGSYMCACPPGWEGKHCEKHMDSCLSCPCLNNATCIHKGKGQFVCLCSSSYVGKLCEIFMPSGYILHFPASSTTDYSLVDFPNTNVSEISVCFWLQSTDNLNYGTAFSYATELDPNTLTLTDYNGFVLYVNGAHAVTDITANDGRWHHICVLWQSVGGMWEVHIDGVLQDHGVGLSTNSSIMGGGKLVLGQEQDNFAGGFNPAESFVGRIYSLDIWARSLTQADISALAKECQQRDLVSLISWNSFLPGIRGKIKVENSTFCSDCPELDPFWHGSVSLKKSDSGTFAHYTCQEGFIFRQSQKKTLKRKCMKQRSWEGDTPVCVRQSCGFPGYLPGGTFQGNSFLYQDKIVYKCNAGFHIIGPVERTCEASGQWSSKIPVCKGQECAALRAPLHGKLTMDVGTVQRAKFVCDEGYILDGPESVQCMHDGSWNEATPDCIPVSCPSPPSIAHAAFKNKNSSNNGYFFGDILEYLCDCGYKLHNSSFFLQCHHDRKWALVHLNTTIPKCCPINFCSNPECPAHGRWEISSGKKEIEGGIHFHSGSVISIICEPNFEVHGPRSKKCSKDGIWYPLDITQCAKIACDTENLPFDIPNSVMHLTGEEVGDVAKLTCKEDHHMVVAESELSPEPSVDDLSYDSGFVAWTCQKDGSWIMTSKLSSDAEYVACVKITQKPCKEPQAPAFGYVSGEQNLTDDVPVGTVVEIRCRRGYNLHGQSSFTCHRNGTWLGFTSTICTPVKCQSPSLPSFMRIESSTAVRETMELGNMITLACIAGYKQEGDLTFRCQADGKWSPVRGKCVPV